MKSKNQNLFLLFVFAVLLVFKLIQFSFRVKGAENLTPLLSPLASFLLIIITFILVIVNRKELALHFKKIKKPSWKILIIIFVFALLIRIFMSPFQHYVFWDEFLHLNAAETLTTTNRLGVCIDGGFEQPCNFFIHYHYPGVYPSFISLFFHVFGIGSMQAFIFSVIISSVSVFLMFAVSNLIFKNERLSLFSALLLACTPLLIKFSSTATPNALSLFTILFSLYCGLTFLKKPTFHMLALTSFSLMLNAYVRHENIFFLVLLLPLFLVYLKKVGKNPLNGKLLLFMLVLAIFIIPLSMVLSLNFSQSWNEQVTGTLVSGGSLAGEITHELVKGIGHHVKFWFGFKYMPFLFLPLFLVGAWFMFKKKPKMLALLGLWFFIFSIISLYFWPSFVYTDARHAVVNYFPYLLICAFGAEAILTFFKSKKTAAVILTLFLLGSFFYTMVALPNITHPANIVTNNAIHYGTQVIDDDCYIISDISYALMSAMEKKAIDWSLISYNLSTTYNTKESNFCAVFFDVTGRLDAMPFPNQNFIAAAMKQTFDFTLIDSYSESLPGGETVNFPIYKLTEKEK